MPDLQSLGPPIPGVPIDGVTEWQGRLYVAQQGCIWTVEDGAWVLAVDAVPPSFPPTKGGAHGDPDP